MDNYKLRNVRPINDLFPDCYNQRVLNPLLETLLEKKCEVGIKKARVFQAVVRDVQGVRGWSSCNKVWLLSENVDVLTCIWTHSSGDVGKKYISFS